MYVRKLILVFLVLSAITTALLYFPPAPTKSEPGKTSGKIIFTPPGIIEVSSAGEASSEPYPNQNTVLWGNLTNVIIKYSVNNVSIGLRIAGDSREGRVVIEEYPSAPESVKTTVPGNPVKYVEISATGIVFAEAEISIHYAFGDLNGADENSLIIYRYDNDTQAWSELPTRVNAKENIASATVNSLSVFALVIPSGKIMVMDSKNSPLNVTIRIYRGNQVIEHENVSEVNTDEVFGENQSARDIPLA